MSERTTIRYTYQDYLSIPEDPSRRHEIVDGELFVTPAPRFRHQQVVGRLLRILMELAEAHELGEVVPGPVTVRLHEEGVLEPDLIFVSSHRLGIVNPDEGVDGPPDLVVEVLSPSNRAFDRSLKRKQYMEHGVAELWIVDADEGTVEVWKPAADGSVAARGVLEWTVAGRRFEIPVADVFRS